MKRQLINPQDSFILDLFTRDTIDRSADVVRLCNVINCTEGCYTIAINGAWGSGKTIYVKQAKMILDYMNGTLANNSPLATQIDTFLAANSHFDKLLLRKSNTKTIYYDAWENDNDIDPVLSIIHAIIKSGQFSLKDKPTHDIGAILSSIAEVVSGRNVTAFFQAAKGDNFLSIIKQEKTICELIDGFFQRITQNKDDRLLLFIDELDRCKPTYAIMLLERIKHYFNNDSITFVFSVNLDQLQHTVRSYYGVDFDASRYLEKFFDLILQMPIHNEEKFLSSIGFSDSAYTSRKVCRAVIKSLNLQLREQEKFVELVKVSGLESLTRRTSTNFEDDRAYFFTMGYILPLILGLQLVDIKGYHEFVRGLNVEPLERLFNNFDSRLLERAGLLTKNETFEPLPVGSSELKHVSISSVTTNLYNILFVNKFDRIRQYTIGSMTFEKEMRDDLLRTACLLSKYSEYK